MLTSTRFCLLNAIKYLEAGGCCESNSCPVHPQTGKPAGQISREGSVQSSLMCLKSLSGEAFSAMQLSGNEPWISDSFFHTMLKISLWAKRNLLY